MVIGYWLYILLKYKSFFLSHNSYFYPYDAALPTPPPLTWLTLSNPNQNRLKTRHFILSLLTCSSRASLRRSVSMSWLLSTALRTLSFLSWIFRCWSSTLFLNTNNYEVFTKRSLVKTFYLVYLSLSCVPELKYKWADTSTTTYDMLDIKSYLKNL